MSDEKLAKELFNQMSFKRKIAHIWEYYKIHIGIGIFLIISALSLINAIFINPAPKLYTGIAFYDIHIADTNLNSWKEQLTKKLVPEEENKEIRCMAFYSSENDSTVQVDSWQRFETLLMAKELDIFVADEEDFKELVYQGYIINLDEYFDTDFINSYDKENMLFKGTNQQDSETKAYGICVKNSTLLKESKDIEPEKTYIGIVRTSINSEKAAKTIKEILSK